MFETDGGVTAANPDFLELKEGIQSLTSTIGKARVIAWQVMFASKPSKFQHMFPTVHRRWALALEPDRTIEHVRTIETQNVNDCIIHRGGRCIGAGRSALEERQAETIEEKAS
jgi:hypothetical protein